ncbi:hypothetical protein HJC23_003642 [Cyclotella cryptica]|uniref:WW domain-containing protein n=1 Tax=Cyclotella cryptica TaxID=29204 RepID=A0ABD3QLG2_9STRA|eukprot:CCRYP_004930-RA/>CCRYP_004930-RA protein AED:0.32 eAED:0.33 QI:0/-1/0/1/-1/1/1/0/843
MGVKQGVNTRPVGCGGKFLSPKGQQYFIVRYEHAFDRFLESSTNQLKGIHREYSKEYVARDVAAQEEMWGVTFDLHRAILSNEMGLHNLQQNKFINQLYENFYKLESKRCISKPNFTRCMNEVFKQTATHRIGTRIDSIYDRFDVLGKDCLNWRQFLFYLHFVSHPTLNCLDQILHAFSFVASHDGIDSTSAKACIELKSIGSVISPLVRADYMHAVICLMDEAWANVTAMSTDELNGRRQPTNITSDVFELMLKQDCIVSLFAQSTSQWGRFKFFPVYVSKWEEEFYNTNLLGLVKQTRTRVAVDEKLKRDGHRTKHQIYVLWIEYTWSRRSLRKSLTLIDSRIKARMQYRGLHSFLGWSIRSHAALTIQRVGRGFFGRRVAAYRWTIKQSAIIIQCRIRMHFAKKRLYELSSVYHDALVTIQRIIRGALGRQLAFKRLMSVVEREHLRNMKEKERLLLLRGIWSVTKLQACIRRIRATSFARELRAIRKRENDIRHAMEARCEAFRKERKVYEKQLEEFYRSKREKHFRDSIMESEVQKHQRNLRSLRRRLRNDDLKNAEPDNMEFVLTKEWKKEWEMKIETGVEELKLHCEHCIRKPDNRAEKKIGASVKKRIKARTSEVLKRADSRDIPIETKEATKIATEEIIYIIGEEERSRLRKEMDKAFEQREQDKNEARLKAEARLKEEKARATVFALSIISKACRNWLARKELRRRCLETYERDYDEHSHRFYYRNKGTGKKSWTKPKAMGAFEMPIKDEWKILRDAHNFPYYFNACQMKMQWSPPMDKTMCCGKVPYFWYREFPVRVGKCPNFATCQIDDNSYCYDCMNKTIGKLSDDAFLN